MKPEQQTGQPAQPPVQTARKTLLCLSHLRWGFVWQRPQQVMSRLASDYDVWFFEEPVFDEQADPHLDVKTVTPGVTVLVPVLPLDLGEQRIISLQRQLLDNWLAQHPGAQWLLWYFTPMGLRFTRHLSGLKVIFDCMHELSARRYAHASLAELERQLLERADLVLTAGRGLRDARRDQHENLHWVPDGVDRAHFSRDRLSAAHEADHEPDDQRYLAHPRLGFFGVLDERLDTGLLRELAMRRPAWQIVLIGPVVNINPDTLPRRPNLHYLGPRAYQTLPAYLWGWDVALIPFVVSEATRLINPPQVLEYLAGGCPVVSTPLVELLDRYPGSEVVRFAATRQTFIEAVGMALNFTRRPEQLKALTDDALQGLSWDSTCAQIKALIETGR